MVSRETFGSEHFFDLTDIWFKDFFATKDYPWQLLEKEFKEKWIQSHIVPNVKGLKLSGSLVLETKTISVGKGKATIEAGSYIVGDQIELREGVHIEAGAWVTGPTILGDKTEVRHGAYVRGGIITGKEAVIGHTSEIKSSILLNNSKIPHFAYLGDSILGNRVNLGAGTKVSNLKITNDEVKLNIEGDRIPTGLRKIGGIVGDDCETGCNSVLNPGVLLGRKCMVYPAIAVRAMYYKPGTRIK